MTIPLAYPRNLINCENVPIIDEVSGNVVGVILGESNLVYGLRCSIFDQKFDLSNLDFENYDIEYIGYDNCWEICALIIKSR